MPSLGTLRQLPDDARIWDREVGREIVGKAISHSRNGSKEVSG